MRNSMRWPGLAAILSLTLSCASTSVQTGSVRGVAVDGNGNRLPGITVSLQTEEGKLVQTVLTGADGSYSVQDVPGREIRPDHHVQRLYGPEAAARDRDRGRDGEPAAPRPRAPGRSGEPEPLTGADSR